MPVQEDVRPPSHLFGNQPCISIPSSEMMKTADSFKHTFARLLSSSGKSLIAHKNKKHLKNIFLKRLSNCCLCSFSPDTKNFLHDLLEGE